MDRIGRWAAHGWCVVAVGIGASGASAQLQEAEAPPPALSPEPTDRPDAAGEPVVEPVRDERAVAVLEQSAVALRQRGALVADFTLSAAEGEFKAFFNTAEGRLAMLLDPTSPADRPSWRVRSVGKGMVPTPGGGEIEFNAVWEGDWIKWVDHQKQEYRESRRGNGAGYLLADDTRLSGLTARVPYEPERAAVTLRHEGTREVAGVECDVVAAELTDPMAMTHRWFIAVEDRLPRRFEKLLPNLGGSVMELRNVRTERAALADESWTVPAPAEYARQIDPRPSARAEPRAAMEVELSPPWIAKDADGAEVTTESLRGRVAVLYFWGTWCIPCRRAAPMNVELFEDYGAREGFAMLGLAVRERDPQAAAAFAADRGYGWRQLVEGEPVAEAYAVTVYPTWIVLGPGGEVLYRSVAPEGGDFAPIFEAIRGAVDRGLTMREGREAQPSGEGGG